MRFNSDSRPNQLEAIAMWDTQSLKSVAANWLKVLLLILLLSLAILPKAIAAPVEDYRYTKGCRPDGTCDLYIYSEHMGQPKCFVLVTYAAGNGFGSYQHPGGTTAEACLSWAKTNSQNQNLEAFQAIGETVTEQADLELSAEEANEFNSIVTTIKQFIFWTLKQGAWLWPFAWFAAIAKRWFPR